MKKIYYFEELERDSNLEELKKKLEKIKNIKEISFSMIKKTLTIFYEENLDLEKVEKIINEHGLKIQKHEQYREIFDSMKSTDLDFKYENILKNGTHEEFINFKKENNIREDFVDEMNIYGLIFQSTLRNPDIEYTRNIIFYLKNQSKFVKDVGYKFNEKYNTNELFIDTEKGKITTLLFSDVIPNALKFYPILDTKKRANSCFSDSKNVALNLGINCDVVTGFVTGYTDKSTYLHSWVETKLHNKDVVIDYTLNAIINKEGYYLFRHVKLINKINSEQIIKDYEKYSDIFNQLDIHSAAYNIFRDEMIRDLEKRKGSV